MLKYSKTLIFLYPERLNKMQTSISSSLIEIGSAIALEKNILIFCDYSEHHNLPKNLMNEYSKNVFRFKTKDKMPFNPIFNDYSSNQSLAGYFGK